MQRLSKWGRGRPCARLSILFTVSLYLLCQHVTPNNRRRPIEQGQFQRQPRVPVCEQFQGPPESLSRPLHRQAYTGGPFNKVENARQPGTAFRFFDFTDCMKIGISAVDEKVLGCQLSRWIV